MVDDQAQDACLRNTDSAAMLQSLAAQTSLHDLTPRQRDSPLLRTCVLDISLSCLTGSSACPATHTV